MYTLHSTYAIECGVAYSYQPNLLYDQISDSELPTLTITDWQDTTTSPSINGVFSYSENPLSSERQAIYQSFAGSLGPACGIQECVGTYKCHMQDYSRIYYETLTNYYSDDPPDKHTINAAQIPISSVNEFQSWFPPGEIHGCERRYRCSCDKPDLQRLVSKEEIRLLDHSAWPGHAFGETFQLCPKSRPSTRVMLPSLQLFVHRCGPPSLSTSRLRAVAMVQRKLNNIAHLKLVPSLVFSHNRVRFRGPAVFPVDLWK